MKSICDVRYKDTDFGLMDFYLPDTVGFDTVVWFHGGSLNSGDRKTDLWKDVVANDIAFVSVDYRLYPQAKFPDFIIDAAEAVSFVEKHIRDYGGNGRIFVSGQSAGAYLTMMLCMNPDYLENAGVPYHHIVGFISDSAQQTVHFNVLAERNLDSRLERIDEAAPMYYLAPDHSIRPLLMIYYQNDMPCRPEQNKLFYKALMRMLENPDATLVELPGEHCAGSTIRDEDGLYPFTKLLVSFVRNHKV